LFLAPIEVFLLVGKVAFHNIVGCGVAGEGLHALVEHLNALLLNFEVRLDLVNGVEDEFATFSTFKLQLAAEVKNTVCEFFHPRHLLAEMIDVFLTEFF